VSSHPPSTPQAVSLSESNPDDRKIAEKAPHPAIRSLELRSDSDNSD
jgi:hypothetical protein